MTRSSLRRARALAAALISAVLVASGLIAGAAPASAAPSYQMAGQITAAQPDGSYAGIEAVVSFYPLDGTGKLWHVYRTSSTGAFSFGIEPGRYRLLAEPRSSADHVRTWYGDTQYEAQGTVIEVTDQDISGLDIRLALGVSISGTISYESDVPREGAAAAFLFDEVAQEWERLAFRANADSTGAYRITGLPHGKYALRFGDRDDQSMTSTVYWEDSDYLLDSKSIVVGDEHLSGYDATLAEGLVWVGRFAGTDRFDTSVDLSSTWVFEDTTAVFIANGLNFPDALSAGPAAARLKAPILLTAPDFIPATVAKRLAELDSTGTEGAEPLDVIYIVGGEPSVSAAVEAQLAAIAPVVRFEGTDRFDTSRQVATYFWGESENRTAYVATGNNFPDALAAAPAAANESAPVVLVNGGASGLDTATSDLLGELGIRKTVIAGGTPSVSAGIADDLRALPSMQESYRRAGADRIQTAIQTNHGSFPLADTALLATGYGFPDALAGAALAGSVYIPIYLVMPECIPEGVIDELLRLKVRDIMLLGGEPTLHWTVEELYYC